MNGSIHHPGTRWAVLPAAIALLGFAGSAQAQSLTNPSQSAASRSRPAKRTNSHVTTLGTIVVTATKRAIPLLEVPDSVTVLGRQLLDQVQANGIGDVAAYVPGLDVQATQDGANRLIIRGLTTGPNDLSPSVGVVVGGVPFGASTGLAVGALFSPDLDPFDVQRIEVLRGPQGTLYGANSLGGLLRYVMRAPNTANFFGHVEANYDYDDDSGAPSHILRAGVNIPLSAGVAGLTVSAYSGEGDGSVTDVRTGASGLNDDTRQGGRIALLLTPTSDLSVTLSALYGKNKSPRTGDITGNAQTLQPTYGEHAGYNYLIGSARTKYRLYSANITYSLPHGTTFKSITGWSNFQAYDLSDDTSIFQPVLGPVLGPLMEFSGVTNPDTDRFTQEFLLTSSSDQALEWQAGVFHDRESTHYFTNILSAFMYGATPPPSLAPIVAALSNFETATVDSSYKSNAVFGNVTYKFSPKFDVGVGLRYAKNRQHVIDTASGFAVTPGTITASSSGSVFLKSLRARWHINPNAMAYVRIANGYRPGGPNVTGHPYNPDTTWNYELGLKGSALNGLLQGSIAAYRINWSNIQLNFFNGVNEVIANAGDARSEGVELEGAWIPSKSLVVHVNLAYDDARITEVEPGALGGAEVGNRLPFDSKWSGAIRADYYLPVAPSLTGDVGFGVRYKSSFNTTFPGDTGDRFYTLPSTTFLDFRAGLAWDRFDLRFQVLNVTNERKVTTAQETLAVPVAVADAMSQPVLLGYTPGRTYGLSFTARF